MKYAVELYYDKETEGKLFGLAEKVAAAGISTKFLDWKTRPHLTLACFNDVDETDCAERLKIFAQSHRTMPACIASVGMFNDTRTIFVSPMMNAGMYQFHRELHECMKGFDTKGWEWYCPDGWAPHCTIALTGDDGEDAFLRASELVLREFGKMFGEFSEIGLVKITFPVEEIFTAELSR